MLRIKIILSAGVFAVLVILIAPGGTCALEGSEHNIGWLNEGHIFNVKEEYRPGNSEFPLIYWNPANANDSPEGCAFTPEGEFTEQHLESINLDALKGKLSLFADKSTKLLIRFLDVNKLNNKNNSYIDNPFPNPSREESKKNWSPCLVVTVDF